ncbi:MAG TPA: hypothetical protein VMY37_01580 [Thermoguttaceae bacterium]|nr:hypothetical protein [Thermoguttaceae bacterium]
MKRFLGYVLLAAFVAVTSGAQQLSRLPGVVFAADRGPRTSATLNTLFAALTSPTTVVLSDGDWRVDADVTVPEDTAVVVLPGSKFDLRSGKTLTFSGGPFYAGPQEVFSGPGSVAGSAVFGYRFTEWGDTDYDIGAGVVDGAVGTVLASYSNRVAAVEAQAADLDVETLGLQTQYSNLVTQVAALGTNVAATVVDIDAGVATASNLVARLAVVSNYVAVLESISTNFAAVVAEVSEFPSRLAAAEAQVAAAVLSVDAAVTNVAAHIADTNNPHAVTLELLGAATNTAFEAHVADTNNPHSVGLADIGAATNTDFEAHVAATNNPHGTTAAQVGAYSTNEVDALIAGGEDAAAVATALATHTNDLANPHGLTLEILGAATNADAVAHYVEGVGVAHGITLGTLGAATNADAVAHYAEGVGVAHGITLGTLGAATNADFLLHGADTNNPHGVTAEQIDAVVQTNFDAHVGAVNPHGTTAADIGAAPLATLTAHTASTNNPHNVTLVQLGLNFTSMFYGATTVPSASGTRSITCSLGRTMSNTGYRVFVAARGVSSTSVQVQDLTVVERYTTYFRVVVTTSAAASLTLDWTVVGAP